MNKKNKRRIRRLYGNLPHAALLHYNTVKSCVCYRLVNLEQNKQLLNTLPYIPFLDLAIVFFIPIADKNGNLLTISISNDLLHTWGIDTDRLYADAHHNTARLLQGKMNPLQNVLYVLYPQWNVYSDEPIPLYAVSNTESSYGAATILYDGLLRSSADLFHDNLIVIPSSVHEILLIPASFTAAAELTCMVSTINHVIVDKEELLSDNLYLYDRITDNLTII